MKYNRAQRANFNTFQISRTLFLLPFFVGIVQIFYSPARAQLNSNPDASAYLQARLTPQAIDLAYANFVHSLKSETGKHEVRRTYARIVSLDIIAKELASEKKYNIKPDLTTQKLLGIKQQIDRLLITPCNASVPEVERLVHSLICIQLNPEPETGAALHLNLDLNLDPNADQIIAAEAGKK